MKRISFFLLFLGLLFWGPESGALEKGALMYHTSADGIIYGQTDLLELPCSVLQAAFGELKSGHAGLYIGDLRIIHAVSEGIVEIESRNFISAEEQNEGFVYLGAKLPVNYDDPAAWPPERKDQLVLIAKEQVGKGYDILFKKQTGPDSGDFTCVGFVEYVYEQVGYTVTPVGYYSGGAGGKSYTQIYNCESTLWRDWDGLNTLAEKVQFSLFTHPLGFCCGRAYEDGKYMFFPYTQFLQTTTIDVETDIPVSGGEGSGGSSGGCFIRSLHR